MAGTPPRAVASRGPVHGARGPGAAGRRRLVVAVALGLFGSLLALGLVAAVAAVGLYLSLSRNLPDPHDLERIAFSQESGIYDRTGQVLLARFGETRRVVVGYDQLPPVLIDATTATEDKTFWTNPGFDPLGIVSAALDTLTGRPRGASTITQQLVRQRLLDPALVADPGRGFARKVEEIIQSIRLSEAYPGSEGKQKIITAYLNQNYYGNQDYGVAAAARDYFGLTDLSRLTLAQAAILAGIPQSPSGYDLVRNAQEECTVAPDANGDCPAGKSQLVVPADAPIVVRRNRILELMASGRTPLTGGRYTPADFAAAEQEPVVLAPQTEERWIAPHFVWAVRDELATKLCGTAATCPALETGGLKVVTTLDASLQAIGERWVQAAAVVPRAKNPQAAAKALGLTYATWMQRLRGKQVNNGALVALDYQTGEVLAYVGSADYYAASSSKRFQPKFDVLADGWRQPGSAFKPFTYVTGIDQHAITAASMFMDVTTDFGGSPSYVPTDADNLERGPVRVRNALQFSLNIPAVKAVSVIGVQAVFDRARQFGLRFRDATPSAGLSLTLGTEVVHPADLATGYATLANGGGYVGRTTILRVIGPGGQDLVPAYQPPAPRQVVDPGAAAIVTDILAGNTQPSVNPFWGAFELTSGGRHRPATLKTGTNNDARDLNAYGYIAPPTAAERARGQYALVVGVWNGNSDNSVVSTPSNPVFSIDVSTHVWQGFMLQATKGWAIDQFALPQGLVRRSVDPFTGLASTARNAVSELFLPGTEPQPGAAGGPCGAQLLQLVGFEASHPGWLSADRAWLDRASRGPGVAGGPQRTRTTYFYQPGFTPFGRTWGDLVGGACASPSPSPTCLTGPLPSGSAAPSGSFVACPSPSASESASPSPSGPPSPSPTVAPSATPKESHGPPTPTPNATPTPTATPGASPNPSP